MRHGPLLTRSSALFAALTLALQADAQTTPAAATSDEAVVLSPFTVSSTADTGYLAANTLAGSRMNTDLRNVANVVSVFTPEFMADLGATTIDDLMDYGLNTQSDLGLGDFNFQGDQASAADTILRQRNYRVRGQVSTVALEYFGQAGPLDTYNLDRAELSSGPNAILFGTGAAGGLLNMSLKRPQFRQVTLENKLMLGSFAERRFTTDLNLPVVKDRLALRFLALTSDEDGWQRLGFKRTDRGTASLLLRPFRRTEISASLEHGSIDQSKNSIASSALDSLSGWLDRRTAAGGRGPLLTRAQAQALGPAAALAQYGVAEVNRHRYTVVTNDGFTANFRQVVESRSVLNNNPRAALPPDLMPGNINYWGPGSRQETRFRNLTVKIDQQLSRDLFAQLSYFNSRSDAGAWFPPGEDALYADANSVLPNADGTPGTTANPYAGRLYLEENWAYRTYNEHDEVYRATLGYQFAAKKWPWLGRHRLAGLVERKESDVSEDRLVEVWDIWSAVPASARTAFAATYGFNFANPEVANNRLWRRQYVTEGNFDTYFAGDRRVPATTTLGGYTLQPTWVTDSANQENLLLTTKSGMAALQSSLLRDRLHLTFGHREERMHARQAVGARDTSDPVALGNPWRRTFVGTQDRDFTTRTRTFGAVFHALPSLGAFYNNSTNSDSPNLRNNVFPSGTMGPPQRGEGEDYGLTAEFFERRLFLRATRYTSLALNGPGTFAVGPDLAVPNAALWDHIESVQNDAVAAGRIAAGHPALVTGPTLESYRVGGVTGDVVDITGAGYEFQAIGNLTPQWRVSLNYGYAEQRRTNVLKFALEYEAMVRAAAEKWEQDFLAATRQTGPLLVNQSFGRTISEVYDRIESELRETKSSQEDFTWGQRPHKVNLFTSYRFATGWARGLRLGGGVIYQSPVATGRFLYYTNRATGARTVRTEPFNEILNRDQVLQRVEAIDGEALWRVDFSGGYTRRLDVLGRKSTLTLQLNVRDVFEQNDPSPRRYRPIDADGSRVITRYNVFPPRTWRLTVGLDF